MNSIVDPNHKIHLVARIEAKLLKSYFCRQKYKIKKCNECHLFKECDKVLYIAQMRREHRVLYNEEAKTNYY